ncbi:phenylacetic acid degradation protein [Kocuria flava]|uniref:Phenylacetic acid degradation protein n=1 Tax=Kocuria flava TaxID=446860 RepID=A0A0U3H6X0_9MICC|nr:1,2-phenylacetyl-CoA epoxidase subunit PaaE [Kocuria flava]ALU38597.1 phenylacetic acid degradation protein [Kocuria flava]MCJ8504635.1 phenylacetate-CoA oxygenase/reductase subunit PaaK [Kocuria flava]GEO93232.1 phenylacetic acid degradation protein [Kocuria flava]
MTDSTAQAPAKRRASFNSLEVSQVRRLTADSVEVAFAVPPELVEDYDYLPGQYVALRAEIGGHEVRRSYSICAEPRPGEIRVAIKKDIGGVFSTWANEQLKAGDRLDVMNPQGAFTSKLRLTSLNDPEKLAAEEVAKNSSVHLVAFAAGSGITPIMAIAKAVLRASETSTFDLVYANRSAMDVMFAEELGDLKDKYPSRLAVHHVLSREQRISPLMSGRIDADKLNEILDEVVQVDRTDEWFLCGPFELVQLCRDTLAARGVPEESIRFELFTTGRPENPQGQQGRVVEADPSGENYGIEFTLDGLSSRIESPKSAHETVLNAALRVRPDVPFACAGGVCGTCRAKVVSGEFEMEENYALEKDEVDAGYVLTCQTRPTTDELVVDFDA